MDFNEIVKKVEETKDLTLDGLFDLWKEAQAVEEGWKKTTVSGKYSEEFRKHFTEDGIINPEAYGSAECKVLVVLKEADLGSEKAKDIILNGKDDHRIFYNDFVNGEYSNNSKQITYINSDNQRENADTSMNQKELVGRMSFLLQGLSRHKNLLGMQPSARQIQAALKAAAVMNLNKRGGEQSTNEGIFRRYCKKYALFIRREIDIIAPDIIVWCAWKSLGCEGYVDEDIPVINMYHTAYKRMPNKLPELLRACGNNQLNQTLERCERSVIDGDMAYNRHVAKYMLVFREKVKKTFEKNKLKL